MAQGYYSLEEAAGILGLAPENLSQMVQRREVRAFADRGTWRFRTQDVEELGRRMGHASNPDLQLGEAPPSSPKRPSKVSGLGSPPPSASKLNAPKPAEEDDLFEFELSTDGNSQLDLGPEIGLPGPATGPPAANTPEPMNLEEPDPIRIVDSGPANPEEGPLFFEGEENAKGYDDGFFLTTNSQLVLDDSSPPRAANEPMGGGMDSAPIGFLDEAPPASPPAAIPMEGGKTRLVQPSVFLVDAESPPAAIPLEPAKTGLLAPGARPSVAKPASRTVAPPVAAKTSLPPQAAKTSLPPPVAKTEFAPIGFQDGNDAFRLESGTELKPDAAGLPADPFVPQDGGKTSLAPSAFLPAAGDTSLRKTKLPPAPQIDSEEQLVPLEDEPSSFIPLPDEEAPAEDNDVQLDFSLENNLTDAEKEGLAAVAGNYGNMPVTQELQLDDLDAGMQMDEDLGLAGHSKTKYHPPAGGSPFELSEADLGDDQPVDLDLAPAPAGEADFELSTDLAAGAGEEEVSLGELTTDSEFADAGGLSGINLHAPADSDRNLGQQAAEGGDAEFELSLDNDAAAEPEEGAAGDSEFELTLDDHGALAALDEDAPPDASTATGDEKDIFETDFEIPALEEESGSEAVALDDADTDLESSEFDFDADKSGSNVVALADEEAEDDLDTDTLARSGGRKAAADEEALEEDSDLLADDSGSQVAALEEELEEEEEEDVRPRRALVGAAPAAEWGPIPTVFLLPSAIIMLLLGLMTYELLHGMWGYKQPSRPAGILLRPIAELFGAEFPND